MTKTYKFDAKWIKDKDPCSEAVTWLNTKRPKSAKALVLLAIKEKKYAWAEWAISRSLTKEDNIRWAIHSAESVIHIFEAVYPKDKRPRQAIEAAKAYLASPTKANASASASYAHAANASAANASASANAASYASASAASASYASASAHAAHAANAASASANASASADDNAAYAADDNAAYAANASASTSAHAYYANVSAYAASKAEGSQDKAREEGIMFGLKLLLKYKGLK